MVPKEGDYVKLIFRNNNIQIEGVVVFWSDSKVVLKSKSSDVVSIVPDIQKDVSLIKLLPSKNIEESLQSQPDKNTQSINVQNKDVASFLKRMNDATSQQPAKYGLPGSFFK